MCLSLAIACFEQAKSCSPNCRELIFDGLVYLGAALHPLQDKYSHTTQVSKKILFFYYHRSTQNIDNASVHADVVLGEVAIKTIAVINNVYLNYKNLLDDYLFYYPDKSIKAVLKTLVKS